MTRPIVDIRCIVWLAATFVVLPICFLSLNCSAAFGQVGEDGTDGTHGESGDPGTDGTDGGDGESIEVDEPDTTQWFKMVHGGRGGYGGNGGNGVDSDDDNNWALGGNAGHGGNGGNASLIYGHNGFSTAVVHGGRGGNGGEMGFGSSRDLNGMGGNGGDGGNTYLNYMSRFNGTARSHGGDGGSAFGAGFVGGQGGTSTFVAQINRNSSFNRLHGSSTAGRGGHGWLGADGGNGGIAKFGFGRSRFIDGDGESNNKRTTFNLVGGAGGNSQNGNGGLGGTSRFNIGAIKDLVPESESAFHQHYFNVSAGSGGKATASGTQSANGGRGAVAFLHTSDKITTTDNGLFTQFNLRGGNGGSALGRRGSGNGGFGGSAGIVGEQQVFESIGVGNLASVSINYLAQGGEGGHAQGSGIAGNGGDVHFNDHFKVRNQANGRFVLTLNGGNGGWGRNNGFGGDATIEVNEAFEVPEGESTDSSQIIYQRLTARGGNAGRGVEPSRVAHGGDAKVVSSETDYRPINLQGTAVAGQGSWGRSGNAMVDLTANVLRSNVLPNNREARVYASASHQNIPNLRPGFGTNAVAKTHAKSDIGTARADSVTRGGWGFIESGHADSMATAEGDVNAYATARSDALGDRNNDTNNYSSSRSFAIGDRLAEAKSYGGSVGKVEFTRASSHARANHAVANTTVSTRTDNWRTNGQLALTANYAESETPGTASTAASMRFLSDTPTEFQGATIEAHVDLMPEQTVADAFVTDNSTFGSVFVDDAAADILGIGTIHGGLEDGDSGNLEVTANVDFMLETRHWFDDSRLMFGLISLENQGNGFSSMSASLQYGERILFDETFTDGNEAFQFFDNLLLDLGSMPFDRDPIEFDFDVAMSFEDSADQFGFGFVFGNANGQQSPGPSNFSAVPEPASAGLVGLFLISGLMRRRK